MTNLKEKIPKLLSSMKEAGYSANYIGSVENMANWICTHCPIYNWNSYEEVEETISSLHTSAVTVKTLLSCLHVIQHFEEDGFISSARQRRLVTSNYRKLYVYYREIVDQVFGKNLTTTDKNYKMWSIVSTFFLRLQRHSILSLNDLSQVDIFKIFASSEKTSFSRTYMATLQKGLICCIPICGKTVIERIVSLLPCPPRVNKNTQFLTHEEIDALKNVLKNNDSISLRDKAIFTIAYYTGLRSIDIVSIKLENIDWRNDLINIIQHKTGRQLCLPLRAVVGNTIFDYFENERPDYDSPYVFLSEKKPHHKLEAASLYGVCRKIMTAAGIRIERGNRRGLHLLRHNLATTLLSNGVAQPVISETLGHASPRSLDHYLDADLVKLKDCSLSIAKYPVKTNLFNP